MRNTVTSIEAPTRTESDAKLRTPLLSVRDLKTHFATDEGVVRAVDGVSFDVYPGQIVGVVGETGCGKSVTARSILRIVQPPGRIVGGEILLDRDGAQVDLTQLPANSRRMRDIRGGDIGLVFQEPMASFSPVHTIGNQIIEAVRLDLHVDRDTARSRAVELLKMVGIPRPEGALTSYAWQLSGGLQQRAMIAMALAGQPRLLIADEPTTALDVTTQAQILELIRGLRNRTDLAIMLITHDLGVIAEMADEVVVMYLGKVVEKGAVDAIFHEPKHPYTKALLSSIPSVEAPARERLSTITGDVPHPSDRPPGCPFHPRCAYVIAGQCELEEPNLRSLESGHQISCHLTDGVPVPLPTPVVRTAEAAPDAPAERAVDIKSMALTAPAMQEGVVDHIAARNGRRTLLEVRELRKFFPIQSGQLGRVHGHVRAVDDVNFDVYEGETLALVGESGSGKTTTAMCILRAIDPDSGSMLFRGRSGEVDLATVPRRQLRRLRTQLQMVFQDPYSSLNPRMTIFDIVSEPLLVNGVTDKSQRTERVTELLGLVGLSRQYMRRFPHALSGGQRQRIGIARALALSPRLVVADEPVSALDVSVRAQTLNLLLDLQRQFGLSYLFVSHDLSVVKHISDRVAVMYVGQLVELGSRDDVFARPLHPYTASLLAAVPRPDPRARTTFTPPRGEVASPANPPSGCYFHPRCPFAVDVCKTEKPTWREIAPAHRVRCHRATELDLTPAMSSPMEAMSSPAD